MPSKRKPAPPTKASRKALPEERARDAIAREEVVPGAGDRVRLTLRLVLTRQDAEAPAARAIRSEKGRGACINSTRRLEP